MKQALHIDATLDQPEFLQNLVEKLAYRRYETGYGMEHVPEGYRALETSSTEAFVSGTMTVEEPGNETIHMPFITCFMFTCVKAKNQPYELCWSFSLS